MGGILYSVRCLQASDFLSIFIEGGKAVVLNKPLPSTYTENTLSLFNIGFPLREACIQ